MEALCGSGRFLVSFMEHGFDISGMDLSSEMLNKLKQKAPNAKYKYRFVQEKFSDKCSDDNDYKLSVSLKTKEGFELILKSKNYYDEQSQTQFSPGIYELYNGTELLQSESMDFQTHLYKFREMEQYLKEIDFTNVKT